MDLHELASAQLTADMGARHFWEAGARAMYKDSRRDQTALRGVLGISLQAKEPEINAVTLGLLARLGMTEDLFRFFNLDGGSGTALAATFWSELDWAREIRQHPKFSDFVEGRGYLEAWQKHGWPDKCKPNAGTDGSNGQFTCT